ncbi:MAG: major facilitator superfamily domain-containing protein [Linnemannia gamsii]|nr:MAG: major facilitator superfamily domain-containing protein [Linnemannia gamsii]
METEPKPPPGPPHSPRSIHYETKDTVEASSTSTVTSGIDPHEKGHSHGDLEQQQESQALSKLPPIRGIRLVLLTIGLFIGCFLASMDLTIIATALPRIASEFNAQSQMSWVATSYLLAYTAFQAIYGRFSDIFGRKSMYLFACTIFLVGSIGCGAASSMTMLILFRAIQGMGGSGLFSLMLIIASDLFETLDERAKFQTIVGLAFGVSGVVGPLLGGVFVEHSTWRWCFYLNLPFGIVAFGLVGKFLDVPFERSNLRGKLARVDYAGVMLVIAAVLCLLLPLAWGGTTYAWNSVVIIALFVVSALLVVALVFVEQRAAEPILPMSLFLNREVAILVSVIGLMGVVFMGCTYYVPVYLQIVKRVSTTESGLRLMPCIFGLVFSTAVSSVLLKRLKDYRIFISTGCAILTLAVGLFILFDIDTSLAEQLIFVLLMGLGQGLIFQNCVLASQDCTEPHERAVATGLVAFINSIGSSVGVAICGTVLNNALLNQLDKLPVESRRIVDEMNVVENINAIRELEGSVYVEVTEAYAKAFQILFVVLTPVIGLAFLLSLFIRRRGTLSSKE